MCETVPARDEATTGANGGRLVKVTTARLIEEPRLVQMAGGPWVLLLPEGAGSADLVEQLAPLLAVVDVAAPDVEGRLTRR